MPGPWTFGGYHVTRSLQSRCRSAPLSLGWSTQFMGCDQHARMHLGSNPWHYRHYRRSVAALSWRCIPRCSPSTACLPPRWDLAPCQFDVPAWVDSPSPGIRLQSPTWGLLGSCDSRKLSWYCHFVVIATFQAILWPWVSWSFSIALRNILKLLSMSSSESHPCHHQVLLLSRSPSQMVSVHPGTY